MKDGFGASFCFWPSLPFVRWLHSTYVSIASKIAKKYHQAHPRTQDRPLEKDPLCLEDWKTWTGRQWFQTGTQTFSKRQSHFIYTLVKGSMLAYCPGKQQLGSWLTYHDSSAFFENANSVLLAVLGRWRQQRSFEASRVSHRDRLHRPWQVSRDIPRWKYGSFFLYRKEVFFF